MEHGKAPSLFSSRRKCLLFLLMLAFTFARVFAEVEPNASLLCISECETCPVLCSPPPSPKSSKPPLSAPPPPPPSSKPPSSPISPPKSPSKSPPINLSPPPFYYFTSPPLPQSPPQNLPPPPSHVVPAGSNPPPPPSYVNVPSTGGQNYTRPYYYIYTSKAAYVSQCHPLVLMIVFFSLLVITESA